MGQEYYCPQCGYDLRGQTVPRCPECGFEYDAQALEFIARESFHGLIGPYLNALAPLIWAGAVSLLGLALSGLPRRSTSLWPCGLMLAPILLLLLSSWVVDWIQNWIFGHMSPTHDRQRTSLFWPLVADRWSWWLRVYAAGMASGSLLLGPSAIVYLAAGLLAFGLWRTWSGERCREKLAQAFGIQHLFIPPHRAQAIARAKTLCWTLAGVDALLLIGMLIR